MKRSGPLQELPLERFLPSYSSLPSNLSVRSHKRPLSPGSPNPYSPTKRRILNSEGIFAPEKTFKTPISSAKASPARFSNVLASSASPARILDFGRPKDYGGEPAKRSFYTPTQTQIPSRKMLISSPELKYRTFQPVSSVHHFSTAVPADTEAYSICSTRTAAVPIVIPRELPPLPDPQSIHYPGFVVFQDAHITVYPTDLNPERVSDAVTNVDSSKENFPPRRKTLGKATLETLMSEATPPGKLKSATGTPNRMIENHGPSFSMHARLGPDSPSPMKVDARKKLRRMMEEDDLGEGQNDDDE